MKIAIKGNELRGKEVIQILESLGGVNVCPLRGNSADSYYYIDYDCNNAIHCHDLKYVNKYCKKYTLEEFEKEFPFKIGTKVIVLDYSNKKGTIINIKPCGPILSYLIKLETGNGVYRTTKYLKPYKEMKEERNLTLTLDKAKKWYKKGGELKEIALQAFTEKELNPLPRSWEEYIMKYGACCFSTRYTNIPLKYDALLKLDQLRDCWRQGNIPQELKYKIRKIRNIYTVVYGAENAFLSFCDQQTAEEFLECFKDLIEKAGDLI